MLRGVYDSLVQLTCHIRSQLDRGYYLRYIDLMLALYIYIAHSVTVRSAAISCRR
jgi:hypothetical protein